MKNNSDRESRVVPYIHEVRGIYMVDVLPSSDSFYVSSFFIYQRSITAR